MTDSTTQTDRHQFVDMYGQPLMLSRNLSVTLGIAFVVIFILSIVVFRLQAQTASMKPLIVRINDVGRADVVNYDATNYKPQPPELRYFLTRFIVLHYGRQRANVRRDYPESLFFLSSQLSDKASNDRSVDTFLNDATADEITIDVRNVTLTVWEAPPYRASVDFVKNFSSAGAAQPRRHEQFTAQIIYTLRDTVSNEYVTVNPLGLQVTDFRVDQAF